MLQRFRQIVAAVVPTFVGSVVPNWLKVTTNAHEWASKPSSAQGGHTIVRVCPSRDSLDRSKQSSVEVMTTHCPLMVNRLVANIGVINKDILRKAGCQLHFRRTRTSSFETMRSRCARPLLPHGHTEKKHRLVSTYRSYSQCNAEC